jgi:hypothetical protein
VRLSRHGEEYKDIIIIIVGVALTTIELRVADVSIILPLALTRLCVCV